MANILDYVSWRGDLLLTERPFNEVDNLILAELSYIDFSGVAPADFTRRGVPLQAAAAQYFALHPKTDMGVLVPDAIPVLLERAAAAPRFAGILLDGYVSRINQVEETQFSAVTMVLPDGSCYVAFRGTDDTLVGWKEDFNMALLPTVPAQQEAVAYLQGAARAYPEARLRVGGHSKGGNLAVYSAVFCGETIQSRLLAVYNNDGPGFRKSLLETAEHKRVADKILTLVPESSVVGRLLEHEETYCTLESAQTGVMQHDGFSWQVTGTAFLRVPEGTLASRVMDDTLREFLTGMSDSQRTQFVDALFEILGCTDAATLTDLKEGGFKTASKMVKALRELDKPTRHALTGTLKLLLKSSVRSVQGELHLGGRLRELPGVETVAEWLESRQENKDAPKAHEKSKE